MTTNDYTKTVKVLENEVKSEKIKKFIKTIDKIKV